MPTRHDRAGAARARGLELEQRVVRELTTARVDRGVSQADLAATLGISRAAYGRLERGESQGLRIRDAVGALDAVGLELSVGIHPAGSPLRDGAHARLIQRLCARCAASIQTRTEVPLPAPGDPRAWDLVLLGLGWRHHVEAETRPSDLQALERRIALKARDTDATGVSLLLLDSRHNRAFVREHDGVLVARFPVPASVALAALRAGVDPGAGSVILL